MRTTFQEVEELLAGPEPAAAFDYLIEQYRAEEKYAVLFEARLMKKRHELGLPLIPTTTLTDIEPEVQRAYDDGSVEAAREVGELFLAQGNIGRAWPYFRAVGDSRPVREAIEQMPEAAELDDVIQVAFNEQVHPKKGFELILENHGICRAITCFGQYPSPEGREESARLLVETLHGEVARNMKRVIEQKEGKIPETESLPELIEGRDWLFEGNSYYVDTSHVGSCIQFGPELQDEATLRLLIELTEYGKGLSEMFQYQGEPPFEDIYEDNGMYLRCIVGDDIDAGVAHFRTKLENYHPDEIGSAPAQVLVKLLVRLGRFDEAIEAFDRFLTDADPTYLSCPNRIQLCQMGRRFDELGRAAEEKGDLLTFAAARMQEKGAATG
jgi:tetratricopeptide (TPR) repeat protein